MPIRAVLFDFDGTLADSYRAITASVNHVRSTRGHGALSVQQVIPHVGRGLPYLLQHCVPDAVVDIDAPAYRAHHPSVMESGTELLPGARETLRVLHERSKRLAICSNKPVVFTRRLVQTLNLAKLVDEVLGPEDVARPKPAPDMLVEAMRRLGLAANECVYVGDMSVDVLAGRDAGVAVWVVPTGSETLAQLEAARPDRILPRLTAIPELLDC